MNILYLIGNGFDLNLGLATGYNAFYDYYKTIEPTTDAIKKVKTRIDADYETWSCLEKGIGKFTSELNHKDELDEVCYDLKKQLAIYLQEQEAKFDFEGADSEKLINFFRNPDAHLPPRETQKLIDFKKNWNNNAWKNDIITFNYTYILDKLLATTLNTRIAVRSNGQDIMLSNLYHVHGYYNNRMVLGVNDISQIANETFRNDIDVVEELVKNDCNKAIGQLIESTCEIKIKNADMIYIFGCSLGETDARWWKAIAERLKKDVRLVIFHFDPKNMDPILANRNNRTARRIVDLFLSRTGLKNQDLDIIREKILVVVNSPIFSGIIDQKLALT